MAIRPKDERIDDPNRPVDVTDFLRIHPPLKTFVLGFQAASRPPRLPPGWHKADGGNVDRVTARIEFADRPAEAAIRKSLRCESESSVVALIVPDSATPLADWADGIRTVHEYAAARLAAVQQRGVTRQPLPKRLLVSGSAMSGYFFPLYDRRTAAVEAELLRLLGSREVPGVFAPGFPAAGSEPEPESLWFWQISQPPQELGLSPGARTTCRPRSRT